MKAAKASIELIAVSCPGGMARQFRVQVASPDTACHWRLVGSFSNHATADQCANRWRETGARTRVIECRSLPTAA